MTDIERLRYYEREYLRSFDFEAEQRYHLEMRRRLNLALHLWGIVDGLELYEDTSTPGISTFSVTPGMAIDAYGREIVLFAAYTLSEDDLIHIPAAGDYVVRLAYSRAPSTPPAPGYRVCDLKDQYTRWRESARIIISNEPPPMAEPGVAASLSDDPDKAPWPIRLGTATVANVGGKRMVTAVVSEDRTYIGLRAQRIKTPTVAPLPPPAPPIDPTLSAFASLDAPLSLAVEPHLVAKQNLIVGNNFVIDKTKVQPPPPPTFPDPKGNAKITNDLFVNGNLYSNVSGDWLGLSEYIKTFTPDILTGIQEVIFPTTSTAPQASDTLKFSVASSRLQKISGAQGTASIAGVRIKTISANPDEALFQITKVAVTPKTTPNNSCDVEVTWVVGPTLTNATTFQSAIIRMWIAYVIVCYP